MITVDRKKVEKVMKDSGLSEFAVTYGCSMQPIHNQMVIVADTEKDNVSDGGIILNKDELPNVSMGTVVAVGAGLFDSSGHQLALTVQRFDRVRLRDNMAETMRLNGTDYHVIREIDVMVILPD